MYYEIHGSAESKGPPLVLLHGGGDTIETSFGHVLSALTRTRRVVAFEQQGYGRTADIADRPFSFEQSADDTAALLDHLKIEKADFLGFSNGGTIALQVAIRHPRLVRKLVAVSAFFSRAGGDPEFWESMRDARLEMLPAELKEAYLKVAPQPKNLETYFQKSARRMREFKDIPPEAIRAIRAPTLIMCGDADVVRPEHAVELSRLLPYAQLAVLPGTDHMTIMRRADWLLPMIETFLDAPLPERRGNKPASSPREPEEWPQLFEHRLNLGDLESVMALYEPEAHLVTRSGETLIGYDPIRRALRGMIDAQTRLDSRVVKAVAVGDIALLHTDFEGTAVDTAGETVAIEHKAIEVLRRQPDGAWKLIVGDPDGRSSRE